MSGDAYPQLTGDASRRVHGAVKILRERAKSASREAHAAQDRGEIEFAASLRGKWHGYTEAADLIEAIEQRRRMDRKFKTLRTVGI